MYLKRKIAIIVVAILLVCTVILLIVFLGKTSESSAGSDTGTTILTSTVETNVTLISATAIAAQSPSNSMQTVISPTNSEIPLSLGAETTSPTFAQSVIYSGIASNSNSASIQTQTSSPTSTQSVISSGIASNSNSVKTSSTSTQTSSTTSTATSSTTTSASTATSSTNTSVNTATQTSSTNTSVKVTSTSTQTTTPIRIVFSAVPNPTLVPVANPDRGFYTQLDLDAAASPVVPWTVDYLKAYAVDYSTLVMMNVVMGPFLNSPISDSFLAVLQQSMDAVDQVGLKIILRFQYTKDYALNPPYGDASPEIVQNHIVQLSPLLTTYARLFTVVQLGFIGTWGEEYFTDYFGGPDTRLPDNSVSEPYMTLRRTLMTQLWNVVPIRIPLSIRVISQKPVYFNVTLPNNASTAYNPITYPASRVSQHDDCFLDTTGSGDWDGGTYLTQSQRDYHSLDSVYGITGGETCATTSYTPCSNAMAEMAQFHYTYLHSVYHPDVITGWKTGGCYNTIRDNLGYRFVLSNVTIRQYGSRLNVTMNGKNAGYSAAYLSRSVIVHVNGSTFNCSQNISSVTDPRKWLGGQSFSEVFLLSFPSSVSSNISISLEIIDPISPRAVDRVIFANNGTADRLTRYNLLVPSMKVQLSADSNSSMVCSGNVI